MENKILAALRTVEDPDLKQDLVTLNMIRDLLVSPDGSVSLRVMLTTPACPLKAKIEADVKAAVQSVPGVTQVTIKMDASVKSHQRAANSSDGKPSLLSGVKQIVAVSSGKGGVGKSTTAVELACALSKMGARVGIMDADIYGPNLPTMMGVTDLPKLLEDPVKGELFIPPVSYGIKVMSMGFLVKEDQPMIWRGPMLHSVINQFCHKVEWGELDYLVIDMPPGTGDVHLSLAQVVPLSGAVMVTTPQEVSLQDVRKAIRMWEKVRVPVLGLVENMSVFVCGNCSTPHELFGSGGASRLSKEFGLECIAKLPLNPKIGRASDGGKPIVLAEPDSALSVMYRDLAQKIAQMLAIREASEKAGPKQFVQIGSFA